MTCVAIPLVHVHRSHYGILNYPVCLCSLYSYNYGAVTVVTGILGVCISTTLSRHLRGRVSNVDPLICAVAILGMAPCLIIIILVASKSIPVTYVRNQI